MSDGLKRILSPFTGHRKWKAWKTREKSVPVECQNLAETDRGSHYKVECLEKFLDSKRAFYYGNESDNDDESSIMNRELNWEFNNEQKQLRKGSVNNSCYKIVQLILLQNLINDFAVCKHCRTLLLVEDGLITVVNTLVHTNAAQKYFLYYPLFSLYIRYLESFIFAKQKLILST